MIAVDGDGTLLCGDLSISAENKRAISFARKMGVHVVLCSGRSYKSIKRFASETELTQEGCFAITFNGAAIYNTFTDKELTVLKIPGDTACEIISEIQRIRRESKLEGLFDIIVYDRYDTAFTERVSEHTAPYAEATDIKLKITTTGGFRKAIIEDIYKILLVGENKALSLVEKCLNERKITRMNVSAFFSMNHLFEITNSLATKGNALEFVAGKLGVPMAQTIAIGDQINDLSMIEAAGLGIAMANAEEGVKAVADHITTKTNDENGVAEVIFNWLR